MSGLLLNNILRDRRAVVIGASAGAIAALSRLLPPLSPDCSLPILVAVHVPVDKPNNIPALSQTRCRVVIKEAEDKEPLLPGTVYFAPPDYHLLVEQDGRLSLSNEEPVNFSRPSIDVLFESAAEAYGRTLLAIVLSGANEDGARGARAVSEAGLAMWEDIDSTILDSAWACAEGIVSSIHQGIFWPPATAMKYDDFDPLIFQEAESSFDPAFLSRVQSMIASGEFQPRPTAP